MAPQSPQRSGRPGGAGPPLDNRSLAPSSLVVVGRDPTTVVDSRAHAARPALSARRHLGRRRRQLRPVLARTRQAVELCLFDADGRETSACRCPSSTEHVWHVYLPEARPGQLYGYRVHGPYEPADGPPLQRQQAAARSLRAGDRRHRQVERRAVRLPGRRARRRPVARPARQRGRDAQVASSSTPPSPGATTGRRARRGTRRSSTRCTSRASPQLHPDVPRSTCAAPTRAWSRRPPSSTCATSASPPSSCCPSTTSSTTSTCVERGLTNYWGYNTIGFFAPDIALRGHAGGRRARSTSSRRWCKALHAAGIEVILDVVYNHTGRGQPPRADALASAASTTPPTTASSPTTARYYMDYTGCGNTLNMRHPAHAAAHHGQPALLGARRCTSTASASIWPPRWPASCTRSTGWASFFDIIHQDPVLSQVKLIAEPWDLGEGGYQVGNFPVAVAGVERQVPRHRARASGRATAAGWRALAYRLTGSSDLYDRSGRRPYASINFVTAHDGFTLTISSRYNDKHNEANGEDNRDGTTDNQSWNCGVEGPTDDAEDPRAARAAEAQLPGHAAALAGRADAAAPATRSAAPSAATTTPTARTTSCPGSTGSSTAARPRCWPSRAGSSACAGTTRCSGAGSSSTAGRSTPTSRT